MHWPLCAHDGTEAEQQVVVAPYLGYEVNVSMHIFFNKSIYGIQDLQIVS